MENEKERMKMAILDMVRGAPQQRLRPYDLEKSLSHKMEVAKRTVKDAVRNLVDEGRLTFTYRDPTSYLELPGPAS